MVLLWVSARGRRGGKRARTREGNADVLVLEDVEEEAQEEEAMGVGLHVIDGGGVYAIEM